MEAVMKRYRVFAQSLVNEGDKIEAVVWAESEESAKNAMYENLIKTELDGALLESPAQMITAEEVTLLPHKITDIVDNIAIYIDEMKLTDDVDTLPNLLTEYTKEYFDNVEFNQEMAKNLAIFGFDRAYRIITILEPADKYARVFITKVMPAIWKAIQDHNINVFYILDNTFSSEEKFETMVELFQLMGVAVVTPYTKQGLKNYETIEKEIADKMADKKMIMYVEKDATINYLEQIKALASQSDYLCLFRNKGFRNSHVELIDSKLS
jgi:hypothetical protein